MNPISGGQKCETTSLVNVAWWFFFNQRAAGKGLCKAPTRDEYVNWICLVCIAISIENVIEL
jgi:hypothetical protein